MKKRKPDQPGAARTGEDHHGDQAHAAFLESLKAMSVQVTLRDGERKIQNFRIAR